MFQCIVYDFSNVHGINCRQQAKLFEERMANVFTGVDGAPSGDQINLTFQKMAEAAAKAVQGIDETAPLPTEPQLADSLTEALKSLKEGSGLLQEPLPVEGLSGMFSGLNFDDVRSIFKYALNRACLRIQISLHFFRKLERIHFCP